MTHVCELKEIQGDIRSESSGAGPVICSALLLVSALHCIMILNTALTQLILRRAFDQLDAKAISLAFSFSYIFVFNTTTKQIKLWGFHKRLRI